MAVEHDWGQDPSVRMMRRVFSRMEIAQSGDKQPWISLSDRGPKLIMIILS
ncbi:MAG: hypothetical protein JRI30_01030 [Deltaproteobacteria bacterium]|nr:hypothetical protein [Deltaproteobacteria bacterium]